ncbi:MAG UNVERIFIED_CONTAM: hypothetical protein LVR18_05705 [Planctomycetaceae bacterium]
MRQAQQDSCIACHMPQRDSKNITHVAQTDHRVLRRTETIPSPAVPENFTNATTLQMQFFGNSRQKLAEWEQQRAMGAGLWAVLARKGLPAPQALGRFFDHALQGRSDDGLTLATLAALESQYGRIDAAAAALHASSGRSGLPRSGGSPACLISPTAVPTGNRPASSPKNCLNWIPVIPAATLFSPTASGISNAPRKPSRPPPNHSTATPRSWKFDAGTRKNSAKPAASTMPTSSSRWWNVWDPRGLANEH